MKALVTTIRIQLKKGTLTYGSVSKSFRTESITK